MINKYSAQVLLVHVYSEAYSSTFLLYPVPIAVAACMGMREVSDH